MKKRFGMYEARCPNCGCDIYQELPYAKKGQKVLLKCPKCKLQFEETIE